MSYSRLKLNHPLISEHRVRRTRRKLCREDYGGVERQTGRETEIEGFCGGWRHIQHPVRVTCYDEQPREEVRGKVVLQHPVETHAGECEGGSVSQRYPFCC